VFAWQQELVLGCGRTLMCMQFAVAVCLAFICCCGKWSIQMEGAESASRPGPFLILALLAWSGIAVDWPNGCD